MLINPTIKYDIPEGFQRNKPYEINPTTGWWFQPLWKIWKSNVVIIPYIWKNKTCQKASYLPNFSPDGSSPSFLRLARLRCFRFRRLQDDGFFAPQRTDEHARWVEMKSTYGNNILKKMWFSINHHQYWNIKFPVAWLYANGQLSGVIRTLNTTTIHNYLLDLIGSDCHPGFRQTCGCPSHILRKPGFHPKNMLVIGGHHHKSAWSSQQHIGHVH